MAFELAEKTGQPRLVARSYNRLGNWQLNVERPHEAARCHDQALSIFEFLHDEEGMAETLDLLGMSSMIGGDLARGVHYYQQAIDINRRLGNQLALAHCLGSQVLAAGGGYQTMTLPAGPLAGTDLTDQGEQARLVTHELGWRDDESFIDMIMAAHSQAHGHYAHALRAGRDGLAIANEIGHRQWTAANHYALGLTYYDILALPEAIQHLEDGLALSRVIRSQHWVRCHIGMLTVAYVDSQALDLAAGVQPIVSDIRQPPQSIGERLVTYGRACLARAHGDFREALAAIDSVIVAAQLVRPGDPPEPVSLLLLFRGSVYADLGQLDHAEADFRSGLAASVAHGKQPLVWRLRKALGQVLGRQRRTEEADQELDQARALVAELAGEVPDAGLQENFRIRSGLFS
jgi:tetratricopeptide (TPR) repeat protein